MAADVTATFRRPPGPFAEAGTARPGRAAPRPSPGRRGRGWLWPLAAVVLGAAGAAFPLTTVVVLAAGAALVLGVAAPRATAALTALAVLFVRPLEHLVQVNAVGYLDETLVVLCLVTMPLRRVIDRKPLRSLPGQWWFALFLVCGLLSALLLHVPAVIFLTGAFVIGKGLLFGWALADDERAGQEDHSRNLQEQCAE